MSITLDQVLGLVGKLDDTPGDETPRERFRRFLSENVKEPGEARDYIEECIRKSGDQFNRALQDLVNYTGKLLEFDVTYGRYQGTPGEIGFDGHWRSPKGFHVVVEVKTTETYAIKVATLVGYVDRLISEKKIPNWDDAMGLYVVGRPDPGVRQIENAIIGEKRTQQLRVISVGSLLSLAEMLDEYDVSQDDILAVLRPSGPTIDPLVGLMTRLIAEEPEVAEKPAKGEEATDTSYWLTPVKPDEEQTAEEVIETLVGKDKVYAYSKRTPGRKFLKPGDHICFYATMKGVVAHATVRTKPSERKHTHVKDPEKYSWVFDVDRVALYLNKPVIIDAALRAKLEVFHDRDPAKAWSWFVQATRKISRHDFEVLTGQ
jgi:hypothetical protein